MHFDPNAYGPVLSQLVDTDRRRPLDAGTPAAGIRDKLQGPSIAAAFGHARIADDDMASCCLSGVWLLHDFLDESHAISQGVHTASGSFWHGILHRREGDFSNAKYWFRQVGFHPIYADLATAARELAVSNSSSAAREVGGRDNWDPFRFVDLCQAAAGGDSADELLMRNIQQSEWELLFNHCYTQAIGPT